MDFPCSVNTSVFAAIWRTKKVTVLGTYDKIMPLWNSLYQLSVLKLIIIMQPTPARGEGRSRCYSGSSLTKTSASDSLTKGEREEKRIHQLIQILTQYHNCKLVAKI